MFKRHQNRILGKFKSKSICKKHCVTCSFVFFRKSKKFKLNISKFFLFCLFHPLVRLKIINIVEILSSIVQKCQSLIICIKISKASKEKGIYLDILRLCMLKIISIQYF